MGGDRTGSLLWTMGADDAGVSQCQGRRRSTPRTSGNSAHHCRPTGIRRRSGRRASSASGRGPAARSSAATGAFTRVIPASDRSATRGPTPTARHGRLILTGARRLRRVRAQSPSWEGPVSAHGTGPTTAALVPGRPGPFLGARRRGHDAAAGVRGPPKAQTNPGVLYRSPGRFWGSLRTSLFICPPSPGPVWP